MNTITLRPDNKLKRKSIFILSTIFVFAILLGVILQIVIPMGGKITGADLSLILWPIVLGTCIFGAIISIPLTFLWINNLEYSIEEERITINKGFITKIQQNIPYRAITDFMLHRSLYDRLLGMGSIRIQTAGQSTTPTGFEANMAGLIEWESLMKELQGRVKKHHSMDRTTEEIPIEGDHEILKSILKEVSDIRKLVENN